LATSAKGKKQNLNPYQQNPRASYQMLYFVIAIYDLQIIVYQKP